jgi:ribosomal protein S18 acetylase RimI-like enzyme
LEYRSHYTQKAFAASTPGVQKVKERIHNKSVWVAICNAKIAGTVSATCIGDDLYIRSMAVDAEFRDAGIARELMKEMEELAKENKCKNLKLTSAFFLIPAMGLYKSLGFIEVGPKNVHGTTLIKMLKNIESNL